MSLAHNNDYLTNNSVDDDFYSFGMRLRLTVGATSYRLVENAFTDRADGFRFDETYLTAGRFLPRSWTGPWNVWVEGGVAYVGEGLLGQTIQNDVHDLLGVSRVELDYLPDADDYYPHLEMEISRFWRPARDLLWGPVVGGSATPGFRWNVMAGWRARWQPSDSFSLDVTLGGRMVDTELALLDPHLDREALAAMVAVELPRGFFVEWSLNRYGTDREHLSFGVRLGFGSTEGSTKNFAVAP